MSVFTCLLLWLPTYFIDWALKDFECHKTSKSFWKKEFFFCFFLPKDKQLKLKAKPNFAGDREQRAKYNVRNKWANGIDHVRLESMRCQWDRSENR